MYEIYFLGWTLHGSFGHVHALLWVLYLFFPNYSLFPLASVFYLGFPKGEPKAKNAVCYFYFFLSSIMNRCLGPKMHACLPN